MAHLDEAQLVEMGALLTNEQAAEVQHQEMMKEMESAEGEQRQQLEEMLSSYQHLDVDSEARGRSGWGVFRRAFHHVAHHVNRGVQHVTHHVHRSVQHASQHVHRGVQQAVNAAKQGINKAISSGCDVTKKVCLDSCKGIRSGAEKTVSAAVQVAKETMSVGKQAVTGLTKVINDIFTSFDLKLSVAGSLDPIEFNFQTEFSFRFGSTSKSFKLSVRYNSMKSPQS